MAQVEPAFHVAVGIVPAVVVKLCWYVPPERKVRVLDGVMVPEEFTRTPEMFTATFTVTVWPL